jgi:hypothetical protein
MEKKNETFEHAPDLHALGVQEGLVGAPSWHYDEFIKLTHQHIKLYKPIMRVVNAFWDQNGACTKAIG